MSDAVARILEHKQDMKTIPPITSKPKQLEKDVAKASDNQLNAEVAKTAQVVAEYAQEHGNAAAELSEHTEAMAKIVATLSAKINAVENSSDHDYIIPETKNPLLSPAFLVPALVLVGIITVGIWLFSLAGILKADTVYLLTVGVAALLVLQVLVSNIRNFQLHHRIAKQSRLAVEDELKLEKARAELFSSATEELQGHLFAITSAIPPGQNKSIDDATNRLMELLDRMSLISNLTRRGADYVLNTEEIELSSQLAHIIADCKAKYRDASVEVQLHAQQHKATLDPLLFEQAISPVINNAIKFSQHAEGGGKVVVQLEALRGGFKLQVIDNGPGIAPERRSQLFKPFSRGEDALRFNYEGAGLGLYLASLATGLLGGSLAIADSKQGSVFEWTFTGLEVQHHEATKHNSADKSKAGSRHLAAHA